MCGRYVDHVPKMATWAKLIDEWPVQRADYRASYNVAPSKPVAAFKYPKGEAMRWGLVPAWAKEFTTQYSTFNARLETVDEKPAFRSAWEKSQHCLIPMLGYYEWTGPKGSKQPYFIRGEANTGLVTAGLYDNWLAQGDLTEAPLLSCSIITKPANQQLASIHPRMPVILTLEAAEQWMNEQTKDAKDLLMEAQPPELSFYPVAKSVGNSRAEGIQLINEINLDAS
jgi:putative SOS response-associated peptidase YedK